jgi:hypothetical protein
LYKEGVYNREQVKAGYIALGNSPEIAEHLTVWTEEAYAPDDKELTKTEILQNYRIKEVSRDTVSGLLGALGYDAEEVEWILASEDYKLKTEETKVAAEDLVAQCVNGTLTFAALETELRKLPISQAARTKYLNNALSEIKKTIKLPTEAKLDEWLKKNIITAQEFETDMLALKVRPIDIQRYLKAAGKKL